MKVKILTTIVRATSEGWEYEPDQRHAEIIVQELGLEEYLGNQGSETEKT